MHAHELLVAPGAHMAPAQVLDGLTSEQAGARVAGAPHTVVEILAHMVFWQDWFLDRCAGVGTPPVAKASLGWPAAGADDWDRLTGEFLANLDRGLKVAGEAWARRLDPAIEFPALAEYTVGDAITHMAVHNSHHLGQIVTLRQMQGTWPPPGGSYTW